MSAPSRRYHVEGRHHIDEWMAATPDVLRRRNLIAWLAAASLDPTQVASTAYRREEGRARRIVHVAVVPGAGCIVSYHVMNVPVRVLYIISVIDDPGFT